MRVLEYVGFAVIVGGMLVYMGLGTVLQPLDEFMADIQMSRYNRSMQ
jgi:hypothetical protein